MNEIIVSKINELSNKIKDVEDIFDFIDIVIFAVMDELYIANAADRDEVERIQKEILRQYNRSLSKREIPCLRDIYEYISSQNEKVIAVAIDRILDMYPAMATNKDLVGAVLEELNRTDIVGDIPAYCFNFLCREELCFVADFDDEEAMGIDSSFDFYKYIDTHSTFIIGDSQQRLFDEFGCHGSDHVITSNKGEFNYYIR